MQLLEISSPNNNKYSQKIKNHSIVNIFHYLNDQHLILIGINNMIVKYNIGK